MHILKFLINIIFKYPLPSFFVIGVFWVVVYVSKNRNGGVKRFEASTTQSREELMKRVSSAWENQTGEKITRSKKTRGGFQIETNDTFISGQKFKTKK